MSGNESEDEAINKIGRVSISATEEVGGDKAKGNVVAADEPATELEVQREPDVRRVIGGEATWLLNSSQKILLL